MDVIELSEKLQVKVNMGDIPHAILKMIEITIDDSIKKSLSPGHVLGIGDSIFMAIVRSFADAVDIEALRKHIVTEMVANSKLSELCDVEKHLEALRNKMH